MVTPTRSGQTVLEVCASMVAVVTVAVALRMLAKLKIKTGLVLDDYAIIVAMVLFYAYTALLLQGTVLFCSSPRWRLFAGRKPIRLT